MVLRALHSIVALANMIFKSYQSRIIIRVLLLLASLSVLAWLLVKEQFTPGLLLLPLLIYQVYDFIRLQQKAQRELEQFVDAVRYRDFSRYFDVRNSPAELQTLRKAFNEITNAFKSVSREKETQYQYLQKILELVNTGIVSYEIESGSIVWMNEALKKLLQIPYLKSLHSLEKRDAALATAIAAIHPGETQVINAKMGQGNGKLLLSATGFQTDGKVYKLIAFQNVSSALDETEAKAWQKLLSVLTHEIMNSVAPISSLADTLGHRLQDHRANAGENSGALEDLTVGIDTIKRRSEGLLQFADTYRTLNKINSLKLSRIRVHDLFETIHHLLQPTLEQKKITMDVILKQTDLELEADSNLIEQVLINLVMNAIEAVKEKEDAQIMLSALSDAAGKPVLKVTDNGIGIPADLLDQIFIPFFSTRKNGSGIGLSLCKQIMLLHRGSIQVHSVIGEGTSFILQF